MPTLERSTIFGQFTSVAATGFLLWTLSSSTFLDASSTFVEKKLILFDHSVKKLRDRTSLQMEMLLQQCMR